MTTVSHRTDNVTPRHETLYTAFLEMACASVPKRQDLSRPDRAEMDRVVTECMASLAALGVAIPTDPKGL
jgi:hypothetical protein